MRCVVVGLLAIVASVISAETIEIRTVADLQSVTNNLGATYELMNDIDLSGVSFEPIGGVDNWDADAFTGTFHGNGHKIVGLKINDTGSYGYVGFFPQDIPRDHHRFADRRRGLGAEQVLRGSRWRVG